MPARRSKYFSDLCTRVQTLKDRTPMRSVVTQIHLAIGIYRIEPHALWGRNFLGVEVPATLGPAGAPPKRVTLGCVRDLW